MQPAPSLSRSTEARDALRSATSAGSPSPSACDPSSRQDPDPAGEQTRWSTPSPCTKPETSSDYLLGYHYHPTTGVSWPHLHIRADASWAGRTGLRKAHTATGRFTVEGFIEYLIDEGGVEPLNKKWCNVLSKNRAIFSTRRTW